MNQTFNNCPVFPPGAQLIPINQAKVGMAGEINDSMITDFVQQRVDVLHRPPVVLLS
ncbi:MAG: hypothetical protein U9N50_08020 [Pseudomonadota bacterium]|nr:hypothetical protein [Pseudomonadota bacterium]